MEWSRKSKNGSFAVLLQPANCSVGAKGRVCRLLHGDEGRVTVEAGAACRVLSVSSDLSFPLGKLEELDEAELPATRSNHRDLYIYI